MDYDADRQTDTQVNKHTTYTQTDKTGQDVDISSTLKLGTFWGHDNCTGKTRGICEVNAIRYDKQKFIAHSDTEV